MLLGNITQSVPCPLMRRSQILRAQDLGFPVAQLVKNLPAMLETRFSSWVRKTPWRRKWQPTPVFLPEESHGQRKLAGYTVHEVTRVRHD